MPISSNSISKSVRRQYMYTEGNKSKDPNNYHMACEKNARQLPLLMVCKCLMTENIDRGNLSQMSLTTGEYRSDRYRKSRHNDYSLSIPMVSRAKQ